MSNRKKILKFCSDRNLTVKSLVWERNRDHAYGDSWDSSCWNLVLCINGVDLLYSHEVRSPRVFSSGVVHVPEDDTTEMAIERMFEEIEEDIKDNSLTSVEQGTTENSRL